MRKCIRCRGGKYPCLCDHIVGFDEGYGFDGGAPASLLKESETFIDDLDIKFKFCPMCGERLSK